MSVEIKDINLNFSGQTKNPAISHKCAFLIGFHGTSFHVYQRANQSSIGVLACVTSLSVGIAINYLWATQRYRNDNSVIWACLVYFPFWHSSQ